MSPGTSLHTYVYSGWLRDVEASMRACGVATAATPIAEAIRFSYFHPLSPPALTPSGPTPRQPLSVAGSAVLRFGFVEGDAIVSAGRAVYDPQGGDLAPFQANGSGADALAIVLNQEEAEAIAGQAGPAAGEIVRQSQGADVVVVKRGCSGAWVHQAALPPASIAAYPSERVFKIGSGDVFSAVFAHYWAERALERVMHLLPVSRRV